MKRTLISLVLVLSIITLSVLSGGSDKTYASVKNDKIVFQLNKNNENPTKIVKWFNNQNQLVVYSGIDKPLVIKAYAIKTPKPDYVFKKYSKIQLYCLAKNIYFESRGEGDEGMKAVAYVTLNRTKSTMFPTAICSVVYQGLRNNDGNLIRNRCQFSWVCDGTPRIIKNIKMWEDSKRIANEVAMTYDRKTDPTFHALFYHTEAISYKKPFRKMKVAITTQIGSHIFYRKTLT